MWAKRAMDELVKHTTSYKFYDNTGLDPQQTRESEVKELIPLPISDPTSKSDPGKKLTSDASFKPDQTERSEQSEIGK